MLKASRSGAYRDLPMTVSCGQCRGCRLERSRQWAVRCVHEASLHDRNCFLTLTYDNEHLPTTGSLDVEHWKLFAKRFRSQLRHQTPPNEKPPPFRYFHCGEYGEENNRPHYHAAIFGHNWAEGRELYKHTPIGDKLYTHPDLTKLWGKGLATFGELTFASAAYVARYIMKKVTGELAEDHYTVIHPDGQYDELKPEYITMSRRPGIGSNWIDKYLDEVYPADQIIINGKPATPPKFYDRRLLEKSPARHKALLIQRAKTTHIHKEDQTPDRLEDREKCITAKTTLYNRKL